MVLDRLHSLFGFFAFLIIAASIGYLRGSRTLNWRVIFWGGALQFLFGAVVLYSPGVLETVQLVIQRLLDFTVEGSRLVFGNLADVSVPVSVTGPNGPLSGIAHTGSVIAFLVLPTIIFVSMLTAILYYLGVLTIVVKALAWLMQRTMGTSGAETLSTAANIFVGQTEAPLIIKPFLAKATTSELFAIMVGGFANIASGVIIVYTQLLEKFIPQVGGHLAAACFISAPATLVIAKLIMPEHEIPQTAREADVTVDEGYENIFDAATRGTTEGMHLALNVGAMLISFTAFVALVNALIGWSGELLGFSSLSMELLLGKVCAPLMWLTGVPWAEATTAGSLLGVKTVLNEFLAYLQMSKGLSESAAYLSPRSALITAYALCGFANFASIGIQIGGISTLAPSRRGDLARIGLLAMVGGALASLMTACVVGTLF